jgi:hypothetical protein
MIDLQMFQLEKQHSATLKLNTESRTSRKNTRGSKPPSIILASWTVQLFEGEQSAVASF